ncbi:xanthan lyase [Rubrivirga sp. IMCC45206]|uniref:golvesin C-terminal-like domain-containing protein n=1 Tax=Rubrivirga sp. IMCC45206 TaxID=3391614 RepID=UPI00398FE92F
MTARLAVVLAVFVAGCGASGPAVDPTPRSAPPTPPSPPRTEVIETAAKTAEARAGVTAALAACRSGGCGVPVASGVELEEIAVVRDTVVVRFSRDLGDAPMRPATVAAFERAIARGLRSGYPGAPVRVETRGDALAALIPNAERAPHERDASRVWAPPVDGPPLTQADAAPLAAGLSGRHVALWPSHGWTYNAGASDWGWQRPRLFTTVEDVLTVGFVTRELAPMLERAGAVTLLPRERDPLPTEVIVDDGTPGYSETGLWIDGPVGFGARAQYADGVLPFRVGRSRAAAGSSAASTAATWTPDLPHAGAYAVHVSYAAGPDRSDAARYRIAHAGGTTDVLVNQSMGAGTWVYLGTFEFEAGRAGSVTLTAATAGETVSADAVRFGGGLGIVAREGRTSGRPRWLEAARYYEQFAGAPASVYNLTGAPDDDYTDDYRSRGEWANWLRGAPFGPTDDRDNPGLGIPVDLVLAWHTDAGIRRDGLVGTLAIYNVPGMDSTRVFPNGVSRLANRDLADGVQTTVVNDLRALYTEAWPRRPLWDRAYSEATRPTVPALLLELLSHQNYRDMRHALDPRFRFDAARAVYKGIGRFLAEQRGEPFVPQPLRPTHFQALLGGAEVALGWRPQADPLEPDAAPDAYVVYTRDGERGWDGGTRVEGTGVRLPAPPVGVVRSYRVTGVNAGGEGQPSEALAVGRAAGSGGTVLVVDGFDRIAAPDAIDQRTRAGFVDPVGVPDGLGVVAVGAQREFDPSAEYVSDARPGWGASGGELEGRAIRGNDRDHAAAHGRALLQAGRSFGSASDEAVASGSVALPGFAAVDLALGLEKRTPWPDPDDTRPPAFEALPTALRQRLGAYLDGGGALVVSGAHWASDAASDPASAAWVRNRLGAEAAGVAVPGEAPATRALAMEGTFVPFVTEYGPDHTAVRASDVLAPVGEGRTVRYYGDYERPAAVARGRTVSFAIPFEAVTDDDLRAALMVHALGLAESGE